MDAPCLLCGYNGANFYQPSTHSCAALWHQAGGNKEKWMRAVVVYLRMENIQLKKRLAQYEKVD